MRLLYQAESESGAEKGQNIPETPLRMDFGEKSALHTRG